MWRETTKHERNRKIWDEEFDDFVPEEILDFHVHVWNEGVIPEGGSFSCAGHPITKYDVEDLKQDLGEVYPGRRTSAVCFGLPDPHYDRERNNRRLADACDGVRFFASRLFDPTEEDAHAVRRDVEERGFVGLKPYPDYVQEKKTENVELRDMLPDRIMEIADDLALLVTIHLPRTKRLADPLNQRQIVDLCRRYRRARIVLAHVGRAYFLKNVAGHLDGLKDLPNLYYDVAMLNHWEVLAYLFRTVGPDRVLYGTDTPIGLAPGKSVEINDQYTYVTPVPWHLSISDDHGRLIFTSFLYEGLRAIRKAVNHLGLGESFVKGIFFENGMRLLGRGATPPGKAGPRGVS